MLVTMLMKMIIIALILLQYDTDNKYNDNN